MILTHTPYHPPTAYSALLHRAGWTSGRYSATPADRRGDPLCSAVPGSASPPPR